MPYLAGSQGHGTTRMRHTLVNSGSVSGGRLIAAEHVGDALPAPVGLAAELFEVFALIADGLPARRADRELVAAGVVGELPRGLADRVLHRDLHPPAGEHAGQDVADGGPPDRRGGVWRQQARVGRVVGLDERAHG